MTTTSAPAPSPAGSVRSVRSLDVPATLAAAAAARRGADHLEADLLALAVHLVDLHPVEDHTPVATWQPVSLLAEDTPLAGPGTPVVAERAVEELGAALDISYRSALALVADALELCLRLPRLWTLVQTGRLQAWKARRVAEQTTLLSRAAVDFVDRQAAITGAGNRLPEHLPGLVHEALVRYDPDIAEGREEAALAHRDVRFDYHGESAATASMTATLDLLDAVDLDTTLSHLAATMASLGDTSPLGVRRSHALGLLAHPQRALDVFDGQASDHSPDHEPGPSDRDGRDHALPPPRRRRPHPRPDTRPGPRAGREARHPHPRPAPEPARASRAREHPTGPGPHPHRRPRRARPAHLDARGRHPARPALRLPRLPRRRQIVRPRPHRALPRPRQRRTTRPNQLTNLACLCRRHHRLKTHTPWHYRSLPHGGHEWTSPYGSTHR